MFSKSKINEPGPRQGPEVPEHLRPDTPDSDPAAAPLGSSAPVPAENAPLAESYEAKPPASILSSDLVIEGNIKSSGDIQVEGHIQGDIRAQLLTVGESATIEGEVMADDVVVNGRVIGRVRGLKVRLTSTARVEGDIVHKTIAIESGAHFEGSVARRDDPMSDGAKPTGPASHRPEMTPARVSTLSYD